MEPEAQPLPPGQVWGRRFIIYAALGVPRVDIQSWRLRVEGLVERPLELTYGQLLARELKRYVASFHCVTKWSIRDVAWEGVSIRQLAQEAKVSPRATWVMFHCLDGYSAPVPIEDALGEEAIIALRINGRPLAPEQGFPARPFIPSLYGWKSAKWLTRIEFMEEYRDGYWEAYGYHERGNVWLEERFKGGLGRHARRSALGSA